MEHYLNLLIKTIFIENIALSFFLGMCTYLAVSKKVETSLGLGVAVIVVHLHHLSGKLPLMLLESTGFTVVDRRQCIRMTRRDAAPDQWWLKHSIRNIS